MFSPHKHSYLQSRTQNVNPRIINRCVTRAREHQSIDVFDLEPPFLRLCSEQPNIPLGQCDVTRRPCAFGRWAMPKLRRELHSADPEIQLQAINTIGDLVHDPERGYEAISLRIPNMLADLLEHRNPIIRERVCIALNTIAGLADGKNAIVKNKRMIKNLALCIEDPVSEVRMKAAACIESVTTDWISIDYLVESKFVELLINNISRREYIEILPIHLRTLQSLMYCSGLNIALKYNAYLIMVNLLEESDNATILAETANCLRILTSGAIGKQLALEYRILNKMKRLIMDERPEVHRAAAGVIMFATVLTLAKVKAKKFKNLPVRLLALAKNWHDPSLQIYCIKALTNICENNIIKEYMIENHLEEINNIHINNDPELSRHKQILIDDVLLK